MIRRLALSALVAMTLLAPCAPAGAKSTNEKARLREVESQLDAQKARAAELDAQSRQANENLKDLRQKMIAATATFNERQQDQQSIEDKLESLATDTARKEAQLRGERSKLGLLTQALVELSLQPPESLLLNAGLTGDTIHRSLLLRAAVPRVREEALALARDIAALDDLKAHMAEQKRLAAAAAANLRDQRQALDQMIRTRQGFLQRTEEQKRALAARLVALTGQARDLRQLLDRVSPRHAHRRESAPAGSVRLRPPVAGRILHGFGDRDADGVISEGVTFSALPSAPVTAPLAGRVVFAGDFRGYGRVVILQHAGGYHSLLAGLGRIDADMDEEVEAGEPVGVTPGGDGPRPQLYFEWRRNDEPVGPAWLAGGR